MMTEILGGMSVVIIYIEYEAKGWRDRGSGTILRREARSMNPRGPRMRGDTYFNVGSSSGVARATRMDG